ncbi:MAG: 3-oxoacyl-ACP synthase [Flavobacteriaceae bacterium]|nr:3-oxoacyl-ACP synthase [Flavobacteriaceae bacterium]
MDINFLKKALYKACLDFVGQRAATVNDIMASSQKSLESETKSSAGDKHETGRAMLQLEMEKASQQLVSIAYMEEILRKLNINDKAKTAKLGSLIFTSSGNYFLAIGLGAVQIGPNQFYVISSTSPIGALLTGKKEGESVFFNGKTILIEEIY